MTNETVMEIVRALAVGVSANDIATSYDVTVDEVLKIQSENSTEIDNRKELSK